MSEQTKPDTKPDTKETKPTEPKVVKKTKLYWPYPINQEGGAPPKIFGRSGELNKAGHFVVEIPSVQVKNELGRAGRRFLNGTEYKEWLSKSE